MYRTKVYAFQPFKSISPFTELRPFWTIFIFSWSIFWKLLFESYAWKRTIIWMQNGYTFFLPCTIPNKDLSFLRFFPVKVTLKQPQKQNETSPFCMMWLSLHFFIHAQQFWIFFLHFLMHKETKKANDKAVHNNKMFAYQQCETVPVGSLLCCPFHPQLIGTSYNSRKRSKWMKMDNNGKSWSSLGRKSSLKNVKKGWKNYEQRMIVYSKWNAEVPCCSFNLMWRIFKSLTISWPSASKKLLKSRLLVSDE